MKYPQGILAFYSGDAACKFGSSYWRHIDGSEVLVTWTGTNPDDYKFEDKVVVGPVTNYVRHGYDGEWPYIWPYIFDVYESGPYELDDECPQDREFFLWEHEDIGGEA